MKTVLCRFFAVMAFAVTFSMIALPLMAQDVIADPAPAITASPSDLLPIEAQNIALKFIFDLATEHAWLATLISIMGLARVFAKPIFSFIHAIIDLTPSTKDDGILASLTTFFAEHWIGKIIAYLIDWTTSIKIVSPSRAAK